VGLTKPCWVDFDSRENITPEQLKQEDYIGHLSDFDIQRIKSQRWDESLT